MQLGSGLQRVAVGGVCQLLELRCCRWLLQLAGKLLQTIGGDAEREGEAGRGRAAVAVGVGGGMLCCRVGGGGGQAQCEFQRTVPAVLWDLGEHPQLSSLCKEGSTANQIVNHRATMASEACGLGGHISMHSAVEEQHASGTAELQQGGALCTNWCSAGAGSRRRVTGCILLAAGHQDILCCYIQGSLQQG